MKVFFTHTAAHTIRTIVNDELDRIHAIPVAERSRMELRHREAILCIPWSFMMLEGFEATGRTLYALADTLSDWAARNSERIANQPMLSACIIATEGEVAAFIAAFESCTPTA